MNQKPGRLWLPGFLIRGSGGTEIVKPAQDGITDLMEKDVKDALVKNVTKQYNQRKDMLPANTQQIVWIDVRGQNVPEERLSWIQEQILMQTQMGMIVVYKVK